MTRPRTVAELARVKRLGPNACVELRRPFGECDLAAWALLGRTPESALPYANGRAEQVVATVRTTGGGGWRAGAGS